MDFTLDPRVDAVRAEIRDFVERRIIPLESDPAAYDDHENIGDAPLQGGDIGMSLLDVAESVLVVITLNVHHDHIRKGQYIIGKARNQGFLFQNTTLDQRRHFRILGFHRGHAAVQI